jgi:hypothetical protein
MTLLLVPAGLMGALVLDGGRLYVVRAEMQLAADAAALAGASSFIDGTAAAADSAQARVEHFIAANPIGGAPAMLESLTMNADSGTLRLVLRYHTDAMLLAPDGVTMRSRAGARSRLVQPGQLGRPIPNQNPLHWWKQEDEVTPAGADSGIVTLSS